MYLLPVPKTLETAIKLRSPLSKQIRWCTSDTEYVCTAQVLGIRSTVPGVTLDADGIFGPRFSGQRPTVQAVRD
jgi:hypothetical protein